MLDLTGTRFPSFSGDSTESTIDLDQASIETLLTMHGKGPVVVKYLFGEEELPSGTYFQIICTETSTGSVSFYSGIGTIEGEIVVIMNIVGADISSPATTRWYAVLKVIA